MKKEPKQEASSLGGEGAAADSNSITVRGIIEAYVQVDKGGGPKATKQYQQLCKAMDSFEAWDEESKVAFLTQLFELHHSLELSCQELVARLCRIKWPAVPANIRAQFTHFLSLLAINHIHHLEVVLTAVCNHFVPTATTPAPSSAQAATAPSTSTSSGVGGMPATIKQEVKEEPMDLKEGVGGSPGSPPLSTQQEVYTLAHGCLALIMECYPRCAHIVVKVCRKCFPHVSAPATKLLAYTSNLLALAGSHASTRTELWTLIIERLVLLDASTVGMQQGNNNNELGGNGWTAGNGGEEQMGVFIMDTTEPSTTANSGYPPSAPPPLPLIADNSPLNKMDLCMALLFAHIAPAQCGQQLEELLLMGGEGTSDILYRHHYDHSAAEDNLAAAEASKPHFNGVNIVKKEEGDEEGAGAMAGGNGSTSSLRLRKLLSHTMAGFEEHVLGAHDPNSTPFLWFFLCSLDKKLLNQMLERLWQRVLAVEPTPNEWKKSHNAAALLSGLLARANFVPFELVCTWLKRMAAWCCSYVDQATSTTATTVLATFQTNGHHHTTTNQMETNGGGGGGRLLLHLPNAGGDGWWLQHGTFYSTVQALLFVFCYRHREFNRAEVLDDVHLWGLGRIIHSRLEPLRYISQAVALCFANISRHLQLIYCSHIIGGGGGDRSYYDGGRLLAAGGGRSSAAAVELYFPFSFCQMEVCSRFLLLLMRRFCASDELMATGQSHHLLLPGKRPGSGGRDGALDDDDEEEEMEGDEFDFMLDGEMEDGGHHRGIPLNNGSMDIDKRTMRSDQLLLGFESSPMQQFSLSVSPPVASYRCFTAT